MAAISTIAVRSEEVLNQLVRREKNWAAREPGVVVVFAIVFVVALGLTALFVSRWLSARKARKASAV